MPSPILTAFSEVRNLRNFSIHSDGDRVNFSCPICGDSHKNKKLARAWVYDDADMPFFHCYNCSTHKNAWFILKRLDSAVYNRYNLEDFELSNKRKSYNRDDGVRYIKTIRLGNTSKLAQDYFNSRKLPASNNISYCTLADVLKFSKKRFDFENPELVHCLGIHWKNREGKLLAIQCRFVQGERRYMFFKTEDKDENMLFNVENVDFSKPVTITEGALDAICIDNAVAAGSIQKFKRAVEILKNIEPGCEIVCMPDSDWRTNKEVRAVVEALSNSEHLQFAIMVTNHKDPAEAYAAEGVVEFDVVDSLSFKLLLVSDV